MCLSQYTSAELFFSAVLKIWWILIHENIKRKINKWKKVQTSRLLGLLCYSYTKTNFGYKSWLFLFFSELKRNLNLKKKIYPIFIYFFCILLFSFHFNLWFITSLFCCECYRYSRVYGTWNVRRALRWECRCLRLWNVHVGNGHVWIPVFWMFWSCPDL